MKKRVIAFLLCLSMAGALFSGCGSAGKTDDGIIEEIAEDNGGELEDEEALTEEEPDGSGEAEETASDGSGVSLLHPFVVQYCLSGYNADNYKILYGRDDAVQLKPEEAARWPRLAETLKAAGEASRSAAEKDFEAYYGEAESFFADVGYDSYDPFSSETKRYVVRADTVAFSVRGDYSDYTGGAHGYYGSYGDNYDTESGARLSIDDVVTDQAKLQDILCEKLLELPDAEDWLDAENMKTMLRENPGEELYSWLLDYDGVSFIFNPYSIAAFAAGSFQVKIFFEEYPELFAEKYRSAPDRYVVSMTPYTAVCADIDGDGGREEIQYFCDIDYEWNEINAVSVKVGDNTVSFPTYCYEIDAYLVHVGERNYIYTFCTRENDFTALEVYELTKSGVEKQEDGMGGYLSVLNFSYGYTDEEERVYRDERATIFFTDPDCFELSSQLYPLGILYGHKSYHVGEDGLPEGNTSYFDVSAEWKKEWIETDGRKETFTARCDMEMRGLKEDFSEAGEDIVVRAGATLEVMRTDNESYVDFRLDDGSLVRAPIAAEEYPYTICDIPMEDALDGIIYAG